MAEAKARQTDERHLGLWDKYLTLWVALCIGAGIGLGRAFPHLSATVGKFTYAGVSIPVAICLFLMIYPIMVQIPFGQVIKAGKAPKPIAITLVANWAIKPFTMALLGMFFLTVVFKGYLPAEAAQSYQAGLILLGVAPCTAMVLMWSHLARGNMGHTLVMTAINSLVMVALYAPLARLLLGISGITVPWNTIAFTVGIYIGTPLLLGYLTRRWALTHRGSEWFASKMTGRMRMISIIALLCTLVVLFIMQGNVIVERPAVVGMLALPIFLNILLVFGITYGIAKFTRLPYEDAAPTAIIAGSNHFEVAVAVATTVFGITSGASLATVVGILTEVPFMLFLVWLCRRTRGYFKHNL